MQLPVPAHIDPDAVVAAIDPGKDVDGLTPVNAGLLAHGTPGLVPCTPAGVMELLRHEGVELEGAEAVVVGRSKLVGVPVARLLLAANATVTICHSRTRDLDATCRRADVLVAAVGVPRLLGADAVKPGAVVIDVGMNRPEDGLLRRRRLRRGGRGGGRDHAGARRGRADDDRDAAGSTPCRRRARERRGVGRRGHEPRRRPHAQMQSSDDPILGGGIRWSYKLVRIEKIAGGTASCSSIFMFFDWFGGLRRRFGGQRRRQSLRGVT